MVRNRIVEQMDVIHEGTITVSGLCFICVDETYDIRLKDEKLIYLIYIDNWQNKMDTVSILSFLRMFACPYRICLVLINGENYIGFCVYCDENERDEMISMMEWLVESHDGWSVMEYNEEKPRIIGIRIPKNQFHKKRLILQGEIFD